MTPKLPLSNAQSSTRMRVLHVCWMQEVWGRAGPNIYSNFAWMALQHTPAQAYLKERRQDWATYIYVYIYVYIYT